MNRIIYWNKSGGNYSDVINYDGRVIASMSNRCVGKITLTRKIFDISADIEDVIQNKQAREYLQQSNRKEYFRISQELPLSTINTIRNLSLVSDKYIEDLNGNRKKIIDIIVSEEKTTDRVGIKLVTLDILTENNQIIYGGQYN